MSLRLLRLATVALAATAAVALAPGHVPGSAGTAAFADTTSTSDPTVRLTTPYPALSVEPGSTVKLDLQAHAPQPERVDLAVDGLPAGWTAILRGGGYVVSGVTAGPDDAGKAQLELTVPEDAQEGDHTLEVVETAPEGTSTLDVTITVQPVVDNGIALSADFPSLRGGPTDTFSYNLKITNNTPTEQAFNFAGTGPDGWTVSASPEAESRANTVTIDAGADATVKVTATPPASVAEGKYPIDVDITGASGGHGTIELTAEVAGTGKLEVTTADQRLNVTGKADTATSETLLVSNSGTAPLDQVSFTATPPSGWKVTFEPTSLTDLAPGQSKQVVATITPADNALAGDYAVSISATAGSEHQQLDLRDTVETSRSWALVGVAVGLVGIVLLVVGYRVFGRR